VTRSGRAPRRAGLGLLVMLVVLAATSSPALALPGPSSMTLGISDDAVFLQSGASVRASWVGRAQSIGSHAVRLGVLWAGVAPTYRPAHWREDDPADPHYQWGALDAAVKTLTARGQRLLLMAWYAPTWAEQGLPPGLPYVGAWNPDPRDFGQFARALAARYSGHFRVHGQALPKVTWFQAWNEPNLSRYLLPQWYRSSSGAFAPASPIVFRGLLNAFYAGVKKAQPHATVISGGTAPFGDTYPGAARMPPAAFLRGLFCLTPSLGRAACPGGPPHLDGLDHHSYSPWYYHAAQRDDISTPDIGRIWTIVHAAQRRHTVLPAGPKSVWMTEIGAESTPPDGSHLVQQAQSLALDLYTLWRQRVTNVFWFTIEDPSVAPGNFIANGGLFSKSGAAKPAAGAFHFPFIAAPSGRQNLTIWGRAPSAGRVTIQRLVHGRWRSLFTLRTTGGGIFYAVTRRYGNGAVLRAVRGRSASMGWPTNVGGT
jgi:hypothetical protein